MKVSVKSNFSFEKLSTKTQFRKKIFEDSTLAISTAIAKNSKKNILDGVKPDLKDSTLISRQEGRSSFKGHNETETPSFNLQPLFYTGRLLNSIKGNKKGLEMLSYGLEHQNGFEGTHGDVPARPFIGELEDNNDTHMKVQDIIVNKINKAIK